MEKLNLNQFLQDPAEQLGHYTLHAVLVHSGKCRASFIMKNKQTNKKRQKTSEIKSVAACLHVTLKFSLSL